MLFVMLVGHQIWEGRGSSCCRLGVKRTHSLYRKHRSYDLIATACQDQRLRIYKLSFEPTLSDNNETTTAVIRSDLIAEFADHNEQVGLDY